MANARWDQKTRWNNVGSGSLLLTERDPDNAAAARADRGILVEDLLGQFRNALAPRGGVALDGTTSGRVTVPISTQVLDSTAYSIVVAYQVPTANPSSTYDNIFALANGNVLSQAAGSVYCYINSSGTLKLDEKDAGAGTTGLLSVANFITNYGGKTVMLALVRSTSLWTLYINGVSVTTSNSALSDTVANAYFGFGGTNSSSLVGKISSASLYNLSLSAADVLEIFELNGAVPERFKWGNQTELVTNGDFSSGTGWATNTGWSVAGGLGVATAVTVNTTMSRSDLAIVQGKAYLSKFTISGYSAGNVRVQLNNLTGLASTVDGTDRAANGTYIEVLVAPGANASTGGFGFIQKNPSPGTYNIDNASLKRVGAVVHLPLDDGLGFVLQDASTNRLHAAMTTTGVAHVVSFYGPARIRRTSSTNGNEQLFGQVCIPANAQILRVRARAQSNTPTVTLGTASGGAQVVASIALSTNWKDLTIALTGGLVGSSNISLWAGSNSTDVVEWDVTWEPLSP